ncbi:MAG: hypothetical protein LBD59_08000 [Prevotellaceae bacterium]|jgi:uncharacterized protein (DUF608 family)|nr:hypothetical protein [Prevotellaceae bacterium]
MKIIVILFICVLTQFSSLAQQKIIDGYPAANFALTVNVSETGALYGHIMQNTGKLGAWLSNRGSAVFMVEKNKARHSFAEFRDRAVNRSFPFVRGAYRGSFLISSQIGVNTFCPLSINDVNTSSLPVLMLEMYVRNPSTVAESFNIIVRPDTAFAKNMTEVVKDQYCGVSNSNYRISCNAPTVWNNGELAVNISLEAGEEKRLHFMLSFYDDQWITAGQFADIDKMTDYARQIWSVLREKTETFGNAIPKTGDTQLDNYLRWYMIPGISLTKCTVKGEILTMGYCELNQRDSYWTSWLHLALFRDAERKMIDESVEYQQPSGKIPTTILPLIERHDDLDINAFFILRVARFYRYYRDFPMLRLHWQSLQKAMDWLVSRDTGDGIPAQVSFWGDWKDVKGVENRKYSPFSALIYLAALKEMLYLAAEQGDSRSIDRYKQIYDRASNFINLPVENGGLWNGNYYCQRWKDGSVNDKLLQDQTIGILFGVVPEDKSNKILDALNQKSLTRYGIAETFPYYPESFGYKPATYHNGAVWPWLSFMDCWARVRAGRKAEAIDLVKRVANADLVVSGDWSPNEHINSLTGDNLGFKLQGWNAGLFGLVYFGLLNPDIIHN